MEKFVARFHERKAINGWRFTIVAGAAIYDLRSDGRKIDIMIDYARNG